ncbi:hypothetical protein Enr10x_22170 [Gimesia panareensis]|uniref:Uncharacterized protein n=1 Tax=Gimesia panareensis TaxID=2527978 RepID=A0A517Q5M9_9PLAN|nr:hypothetical protein [Gimesia panareensis]QDT26905.1 hypothetical protein Enr10x_22170 [Gimesia panareensis]
MNEIPEPEKFFSQSSLYEKFSITEDNVIKYLAIEFFTGILDVHCVECGRHSTFKLSNEVALPQISSSPFGDNPNPTPVKEIKQMEQFKEYYFLIKDKYRAMYPIKYARIPNLFAKVFTCGRNQNHHMLFYIQSSGDTFQKIGQSPSLRDLHLPELEKYKSVLGRDNLNELRTGVGLYAHGVGIGAFVYLRRVIENLIEKAHVIAKNNPDFDDENFSDLRMSEKIKSLKGFLPDFLVENRKVYGILSKGGYCNISSVNYLCGGVVLVI